MIERWSFLDNETPAFSRVSEEEINLLFEREAGVSEEVPEKMLAQWFVGEIKHYFGLASSQSLVNTNQNPEQQQKSVDAIVSSLRSLDTVVQVVAAYRTIVPDLKAKYAVYKETKEESAKQSLVSELNEYYTKFFETLKNHLAATTHLSKQPFPMDITKLAFSFASVDTEKLDFLGAFLHDFKNIYEHLVSIPEGYEDVLTLDFMVSSLQDIITQSFELLEGFDLEHFSYVFSPTSLSQSMAKVNEFSFKFDQRQVGQEGVRVISEENIGQQLYELFISHQVFDKKGFYLNKEEKNEKGKSVTVMFDSTGAEISKKNKVWLNTVMTKISGAFLISLFGNVRQNVRRVNNNLATMEEDKKISEIRVRTTLFIDSTIDPSQVVIEEAGVKKGVWLGVTVADNGPGFPATATDAVGDSLGEQIRLFTPEKNKSSHGGSGEALFNMSEAVRENEGFFIAGSTLSAEKKGARITVAFPLLWK